MLKQEKISSLIAVCALLCGTSVLLGAFGTHILTDIISDEKLVTFNKAGYYLMIHSISVILLLLVKNTINLQISYFSIKALLSGALIFSISLYLLSFSELHAMAFLKFFGILAPVGGVIMILAWVFIALGLIKKHKK